MKKIVLAFCLGLLSNIVFAESDHDVSHSTQQTQFQGQHQEQSQQSTITANPTAQASVVANPTATANAVSSPTTTSSANVSVTSGVIVDPGAIINSPTNNVTGGPVSVDATNQGVHLVGGSQSVQVDAPIIPPPAANIPQVSGSVPQLLPSPEATANEKAMDFTMFYSRVCPSPAVLGYDLKTRMYEGASGNSEIVFTPHLDYAKAVKKQSSNPFEDSLSQKTIKVQEVSPPAFGKSGHYKCLGMITISAKETKAGKATPVSVLSDATLFPLKEMEGFEKIVLLAPYNPYEVIANTKGVDNDGRGYGLGLGLSKFVNPVVGTLGGSASDNSGVTYPETKMGITLIVAVEDPSGPFIDLSEKKPVVQEAPPVIKIIPKAVEPPKVKEPETKPVEEEKKMVASVKKKPKKGGKAKKPVSPPPQITHVKCTKNKPCSVVGDIEVPASAIQKPEVHSSASGVPSATEPVKNHLEINEERKSLPQKKKEGIFFLDVFSLIRKETSVTVT